MHPPLTVSLRGAAVCALLACLSLEAAHGQMLLGRATSAPGNGTMGPITAIGDINADGISDQLIGLPLANGQQGRAELRSGADGALLASLDGEFGGALFGWSVAAVHDVDGDGQPDFAVGAPATSLGSQGGTVFVYSGSGAVLLRRINGTATGAGFGYGLAGLGDMDGDGLADLLVSAPFANNGRGQVSSFSGATGMVLSTRSGNQPGDWYGISVAGTLASGDGSPEPIIGATLLSGDSSPEPIIGAALSGDSSPEPIIGASQAGNGGPGYIEILSRSDFSALLSSGGDAPGDRFGLTVAQAGDVDGDGTLDFLVGASPQNIGGTASGSGYARVLSGWDGTPLLTLSDGLPGSAYGEALAGVGDLDGDGHDDLAVGAPDDAGLAGPASHSGALHIYSGLDGSPLQLIVGTSGSRLGSRVTFAGDLDGDGQADLALAANANGAASWSSFSLAPWSAASAGMTSGGLAIPVSSTAANGTTSSSVTLSLRNALTLAPTSLVVGFSLVFDAASGSLAPSSDILVNGLQTDTTGSLDYALTLPASLSAATVISYQFTVADPAAAGGTSESNVATR